MALHQNLTGVFLYAVIDLVVDQIIAVPFEKRLISTTFSQPSAGRKYTDNFTFEDCYKS
jgi:hypothetical protein